jgi:hypothetical protein
MRLTGHGLGPDPTWGELDVVSGKLGMVGVGCRSAEQGIEVLRWQLYNYATGGPEQVAVVNKGGELIDPLAQALFRAQLPQQTHDLAHHQKAIAVVSLDSAVGQGQLN